MPQIRQSVFWPLVFLALCLAVLAAGLGPTPRRSLPSITTPAAAQLAEDCANQLILDPASSRFLTSDSLFTLVGQPSVNCYAWQMFIAMNWPVDPAWPASPVKAGEPDRSASARQWGLPSAKGQTMPTTVWSSYKDVQDIFLPGAAKPSGWGETPPITPACGAINARMAHVRGAPKRLSITSKAAVNAAHGFHLGTGTSATLSNEIMEALGGWLTDQSGNLVYFERKVNLPEFNYIFDNMLYDAASQLRVATNSDRKSSSGLSLPMGDYLPKAPAKPQLQTDIGSIEIKSAWRVLTGQTALYSRYLTSPAYLTNPDTGVCTEEIVGLVGLHIIHKTPTFPDFIWATFEQVDNVPDGQSPLQPAGYSFNNPACQGSACTPNQKRIECTDPKPCRDLYPKSQPVQVTRVQQATKSLNELNTAVQAKIASTTGGKSVFQYYKLVNVLWDGAASPPVLEPGPSAKVPLTYGSFISESNLSVANTVLETYTQNTSCNDCHAFAKIAGETKFASDFSFIFQDADSALQPSLVTRSKEFK